MSLKHPSSYFAASCSPARSPGRPPAALALDGPGHSSPSRRGWRQERAASAPPGFSLPHSAFLAQLPELSRSAAPGDLRSWAELGAYLGPAPAPDPNSSLHNVPQAKASARPPVPPCVLQVTLLGPLPTLQDPTGQARVRPAPPEAPAHPSPPRQLHWPTCRHVLTDTCREPVPRLLRHPALNCPSSQDRPCRALSPTSCSSHPAPGPRLTQHPVPSSCTPGSIAVLPSPPPLPQAWVAAGAALLALRVPQDVLLLPGAHREDPSFQELRLSQDHDRREHQDVTGVSPSTRPCPAHSSANPRPPRRMPRPS